MTTQNVEISTPTAPAAEGHACTCGHATDEEIVLDVRTLPRPIRHAAVRGAFSAIPVDGSLVLVAPHKPQRLIAEIQGDVAGALAVEYLVDEPAECRVRLTRLATPAV
jgi:uncharacterized protein (DUF2249 family)